MERYIQNAKTLFCNKPPFSIRLQQTILTCSKISCKRPLTTNETFLCLFSAADCGKQRSTCTTPFLTDISEAVFRSHKPPPTHPQECPTNAFEFAVERKAWWRMKRIFFPDKIKEKNMSSIHFKIVPDVILRNNEAAKRCPVMEKFWVFLHLSGRCSCYGWYTAEEDQKEPLELTSCC